MASIHCHPSTVDDLVGDGRNQVRRHLGAVQLQQMRLDLAHTHTACAHAEDVVIEAGHPALMLGDQLRFKARQAIARHVQIELATRRQHLLRTAAVAVVFAASFLVGQVENVRKAGIRQNCRLPFTKS